MWDIIHTYWIQLAIGSFPIGELGGVAKTLLLAITGLVCAFPLAIIVGIARTSDCKWVFIPVSIYVHCIRGLPVLMLIFWAYFMVPFFIGDTVSGTTTLICALIIYEVAFLGEVIKGGILAIPQGQIEASRSLGMGYIRTMWEIVLPQALFNIIPSILNQFINLIKNTSLGYIISVNELTYAAYQVNGQLLTKPFQVYFLLAMIYFVLCYSLSKLVGYIEKTIKKRRQIKVQLKVV